MCAIIAIIVILIILIIIYIYRDYKTKRRYLDGFWRVSNTFKEEAGIDDGMVYFNTDLSTCYILLSVDSEVLINEKIEFSMCSRKINLLNKDSDALPEVMRYKLDIPAGRLMLYTIDSDGEEVLHLDLFKDLDSSHNILLE